MAGFGAVLGGWALCALPLLWAIIAFVLFADNDFGNFHSLTDRAIRFIQPPLPPCVYFVPQVR